MTNFNANASDLHPIFHPATHYASPAGMSHAIRLVDILAALRQLDGDNDDDDPPRGGGVPMRLRRPWAAAQRGVL